MLKCTLIRPSEEKNKYVCVDKKKRICEFKKNANYNSQRGRDDNSIDFGMVVDIKFVHTIFYTRMFALWIDRSELINKERLSID